jgi:hypothetical protein
LVDGLAVPPNAGEARRPTGEAHTHWAAAALARPTGVAVIVTDGPEGALLLEEPGGEALVPADAIRRYGRGRARGGMPTETEVRAVLGVRG